MILSYFAVMKAKPARKHHWQFLPQFISVDKTLGGFVHSSKTSWHSRHSQLNPCPNWNFQGEYRYENTEQKLEKFYVEDLTYQ